jgi:hypothetical protein
MRHGLYLEGKPMDQEAGDSRNQPRIVLPRLQRAGRKVFESATARLSAEGAHMKARGKRAARRPWFMQYELSGLKGRNICSIAPFEGAE